MTVVAGLAGQHVEVEGRELRLTNLDKLLWPEDGIRKADLIDYYLKVADVLLPHLRGRPLTLTRYPDGITGGSFYQKDRPEHAPEWIRTYPYRGEGHVIRFVLAEERATLAWLGNQACLEIHPAPWQVSHPDLPDRLVIDLDPAPPATFEDVRRAAVMVRTLLEQLGVRGFPKTSGATGIHVFIPLVPDAGPEEVTRVAETLARVLRAARPDLITLERAVRNRTGKVYVDYLQNARGKTMVAPYSPRALPGAPVSAPFAWDELEHVLPREFTIRTLPDRLARRGDLAAGLLGAGHRLSDLAGRLRGVH
ncbi:MAG: non-homologous end-joining DNA ligase [Bacillota bacterium]